MPRTPLVVAAAVLALCACRKPTDSAAPEQACTQSDPAQPVDPRVAGPVELSQAIPADAAAVLVVRTPETLIEAAAALSWLGSSDLAAVDRFRAQLDRFTMSRIGVALSTATSLTVFYALEPERVGMIVEGIHGQLSGSVLAEHGDAQLRLIDPELELLGLMRDGSLMIGNEAGLAGMLEALAGDAPALADARGGLGEVLAEYSAGASLALVAEAPTLPWELAEITAELGVEQVYADFSRLGARAIGFGDPRQIRAGAALLDEELAEVLEDFDELKRRAMVDEGLSEGITSIAAEYAVQRVALMLTPKIVDDQLRFEIPITLADADAFAAVAGVLAAAVTPGLTSYGRKAKTAEAKTQLAKLYDATSSYFRVEHVGRDNPPVAPHRCPNDGEPAGQSGITPPLHVNCNEGPDHRCVPVSGTPGPGEYSRELWTNNPVWSELYFELEQGHYYHYNFIWANEARGYGRCQFTIQAFGDLDNDGIFSTFERAGAGDEYGVNAAIGLYVDHELE